MNASSRCSVCRASIPARQPYVTYNRHVEVQQSRFPMAPITVLEAEDLEMRCVGCDRPKPLTARDLRMAWLPLILCAVAFAFIVVVIWRDTTRVADPAMVAWLAGLLWYRLYAGIRAGHQASPPTVAPQTCQHLAAVPVTSLNGDIVAWLCPPPCDTQLPPEFRDED